MFRVSKSIEDTKKIGEELLLVVHENLSSNEEATVIGLSGDLGAGKTTFAQQLAETLEVKERVTSPTYVILKMYDVNSHALHSEKKFEYKKLIHIDAYRLRDGNDLSSLGFETLLNDKQNLILIEWWQKVEDILPRDIVKIQIDTINPYTRNIEIEFPFKE